MVSCMHINLVVYAIRVQCMCIGSYTCKCTCKCDMCIPVWIHVCSSTHSCGCVVDGGTLWRLFVITQCELVRYWM